MKKINNYILEKLVINKNSRDCRPLKKDGIVYCVYAVGDDEVRWHPIHASDHHFKYAEDAEDYLLKKFKDEDIRYLKTFDNAADATRYELNELPDILKHEKNR